MYNLQTDRALLLGGISRVYEAEHCLDRAHGCWVAEDGAAVLGQDFEDRCELAYRRARAALRELSAVINEGLEASA